MDFYYNEEEVAHDGNEILVNEFIESFQEKKYKRIQYNKKKWSHSIMPKDIVSQKINNDGKETSKNVECSTNGINEASASTLSNIIESHETNQMDIENEDEINYENDMIVSPGTGR